jgi:hypothetical protein
MQINAATEPVAGKFTWVAYNAGADGNRALVAVLGPKGSSLFGYGMLDVYVSGEVGQIYIPAIGDELNMLVADVAGTADTRAIGDIMIITNGTGKLKGTTGTPQSQPFIVMETTPAPTADILVQCMYNGY